MLNTPPRASAGPARSSSFSGGCPWMTTPSARVPCSRPGSLGGTAGPVCFRRPVGRPPVRCLGPGWLGLP
eukprot:11003300-Alexandrium_andersonii.AAC.1